MNTLIHIAIMALSLTFFFKGDYKSAFIVIFLSHLLEVVTTVIIPLINSRIHIVSVRDLHRLFSGLEITQDAEKRDVVLHYITQHLEKGEKGAEEDWDYLCSELEILQDEEKKDMIRDYIVNLKVREL